VTGRVAVKVEKYNRHRLGAAASAQGRRTPPAKRRLVRNALALSTPFASKNVWLLGISVKSTRYRPR